ncbi:ribosome hibernation-promoting factor, HPF/YfiA family [Pseudodesulfovibrio senegalensis]|jgi:putative sigma-54 modulation protein|uniref:Ribosome hibernation promoting factor n=1 Tax=Pseudodesulfovibrio senegalensis TaxID=1721087 RepID=A0A6N6NAT9_9BACT|nr:ribosome-associated translation inhibitor RaiA [Pseudodesulfovibrio senegalensis]KAB1443757.1 ribosome-associated translation inhibitor RaiA [Pseudodesulfovibrio senegalensis]
MNISFTFKNFDPSDHLKKYAEKRFGKLGKYVSHSDTAELKVNLMVEKFRQKADVVLNADNIHLSAFETSEDMYSSIDLVLDKLEAQLRKLREKMKDRGKKARANKVVQMDYLSFLEKESGNWTPTIVGSDSYEPKPMSVDEAAMQLDTTDGEFLVFRNADTEGINVIYKRNNGDFGLIDPGH